MRYERTTTKNMGTSQVKTTNQRRKQETVNESHQKQHAGESDSNTLDIVLSGISIN